LRLNFLSVLKPRERRRQAPEPLTLTVAGTEHAVTLRTSERARRFTLRVKPGTQEIVLTAPSWARAADARAFALRHQDWVAERLERGAARTPFEPGAIVPIRGFAHQIVHRPGVRGVAWIAEGEGGPELHVAGRGEHVPRRVLDFLKAEARRDLAPAVARYAERVGRPVARLVVRDQTTRWGSCSAAGVLSFSWRLILAPPFVLDYLAAHEAAHLREMNHGPRFWRLLHDICPDTERAKEWMRAHGASLHAYGPPAGARPAHDAA
jgi:predicted metal-dependent hydrolase